MLDFFNNGDLNDEVLRLIEQAIAIHSRVDRMSLNVGVGESNLGSAYARRAQKAYHSDDMDRYFALLKLALPHHREAARVYRAINHVDAAGRALSAVNDIGEILRDAGIS